MNAYVDPNLCIGCTQCTGLCPAVFHMAGVLAVAEPGPIPPAAVPPAVHAALQKGLCLIDGHDHRNTWHTTTPLGAFSRLHNRSIVPDSAGKVNMGFIWSLLAGALVKSSSVICPTGFLAGGSAL